MGSPFSPNPQHRYPASPYASLAIKREPVPLDAVSSPLTLARTSGDYLGISTSDSRLLVVHCSYAGNLTTEWPFSEAFSQCETPEKRKRYPAAEEEPFAVLRVSTRVVFWYGQYFADASNAAKDCRKALTSSGHALDVEKTMIRPYKGVLPTIPDTCYVDISAQVIGDVVLGEHASIWMNAVVRGDVHYIRIGKNTNIQDNSVLHGMLGKWPVVLGDDVTVGHTVTLHGCVIEDRCLIGMGVIILNGARVGRDSILAAGTLIPEGAVVEPGSLWMGAPGKFRRYLSEEEKASILTYRTNYLGYKEQYLREIGQ
jgi:carbonic anhydrase/acetyltransferase-like protein (isoleucine patch superfamily)